MHEVEKMEIFLFLLKPFLIAIAAILSIAYFSRWFFEYSIGVEGISEKIWLFWIPGFLSFLFWGILIRRRVNLLNLPDGNGNGPFLIHGLLLVSLALSGIFSQFYQKRSNLNIVSINATSEIDPSDWAKCYNLNSLEIDHELITGAEFAHSDGRYNEDLNYDAFFVVPFGRSKDGNTVYWIGKMYSKQISNRSSDNYKDEMWKAHYSASYSDFKRLEKSRSEYLYPIQRGEDFENYSKAIERFEWSQGVKHRVFEYYSGDLGEDQKNMLIGLVFSIAGGILLLVLLIQFGVRSAHSFYDFKKGRINISGDEKDVLNFLLLRGSAPITAILVYACLAGYLITGFIDGNIFVMKTDRLVDYGALSKVLVKEGEYWRLMSHIFLHSNFRHIIYNLSSLLIVGIMIEPHLGKVKYLLIFFLTGIGAGIVSVSVHESVGVGASGAIYGLFGWLFSAIFIYRSRIHDLAGVAVFLFIIVCVSTVIGFLMPGIDHAAHFGGLGIGLVLGALIPPNKKGVR